MWRRVVLVTVAVAVLAACSLFPPAADRTLGLLVENRSQEPIELELRARSGGFRDAVVEPCTAFRATDMGVSVGDELLLNGEPVHRFAPIPEPNIAGMRVATFDAGPPLVSFEEDFPDEAEILPVC